MFLLRKGLRESLRWTQEPLPARTNTPTHNPGIGSSYLSGFRDRVLALRNIHLSVEGLCAQGEKIWPHVLA